MLLLLRWPRLLQDVLNRRLLFKTNRQKVAPKETITHHFFVSELGRRKPSMQPKFVAAENVVKTETQQTFVNGLLGFITRHLYSAGSACVLLTIIAWVAHRYGQLYLHCSLIYFWVPSSCFCIVISLSLEGEIIPFSGVCQSGEAALSTPEAVAASRTDWQTALMCNRRRPATTSSRRASFSALASAQLLRVFCIERSNITLTHLHVSNCRVRQLQFSGIFVALGFVGNGVITVMWLTAQRQAERWWCR